MFKPAWYVYEQHDESKPLGVVWADTALQALDLASEKWPDINPICVMRLRLA